MGRDCADGRKNGSINGAAVVEGNANYFLSFFDAGRVKGLGEVWGRR